MWIFLLQGIGYGFAAAVQPGPLQTYIISQTVEKGWRRALPAALAPLVSDGPIIALCLLVLSQVPPWFEKVLYVAGGGFVLYLAYGAYQAWRDFTPAATSVDVAPHQSVFKAAFVNLLSPGPYIFWSLVTGPILVAGWREAPGLGVVFMLGFYVTFVLMLMATMLVFGILRQGGEKIRRALLGLSAAALGGFGLYQLWLGLG